MAGCPFIVPPLLSWERNAGSLFTKEDPFNLHKTFGFAVLLHFLYRLALLPAGFWSGTDLMGFGVGRPETPWLLSLHSFLLLISFAFHIPSKRIKQGSRSEWRTLPCAPLVSFQPSPLLAFLQSGHSSGGTTRSSTTAPSP